MVYCSNLAYFVGYHFVIAQVGLFQRSWSPSVENISKGITALWSSSRCTLECLQFFGRYFLQNPEVNVQTSRVTDFDVRAYKSSIILCSSAPYRNIDCRCGRPSRHHAVYIPNFKSFTAKYYFCERKTVVLDIILERGLPHLYDFP